MREPLLFFMEGPNVDVCRQLARRWRVSRGERQDTSVCDGVGRLHDTPNLFVLGGATFNSCAGQNPTLTIAARAWRTADGVVQDLW